MYISILASPDYADYASIYDLISNLSNKDEILIRQVGIQNYEEYIQDICEHLNVPCYSIFDAFELADKLIVLEPGKFINEMHYSGKQINHELQPSQEGRDELSL